MSYGCFIHCRKYMFNSTVTNSANVINKVKYCVATNVRKETLIERWKIYWKNVYTDYKDAALDTVKDCREHPIRTAMYASLLGTCIVLSKHKPDEYSFKDNLLQNTMKIMQVGEVIRNPESESHVKWLGDCYNEGIVRWLNVGIFSLIWLDNYDETCSLYKAVCPYLKVRYLTFYQRIVDLGFLDKWWILDNKMKDYDVNEETLNDVK